AAPTPGPVIDTVAGGGDKLSLDNQDPLVARFYFPRALAYDYGAQVLYIADNDNHLIRKYDVVSHAVTTVVYLGAPATADSPAATAATGSAFGLAVGSDGTLYFADAEHNVIKRLRRNGDPETIAGTGKIGADDGAAITATFNSPVDLAYGVDGKLYVADQLNNRVRAIDLTLPSYPVTTVAGTGGGGFAGDAGPAVKATIDLPTAVAMSPSGTVLYVAEGKGLRVRKIQLATGTIDTVAGTGTSSTAGEGGPALKAGLSLPLDLAFDGAGNLIIADGWAGRLGNGTAFVNGSASRILRVGTDGKLVRIAGELRSANGFSGDGKSPVQAELNNPSGLAFDSQGVLYIADTNNCRIRTITVPPPPPPPSPTPAPSDSPITPSPAPSP
ncbi:MAG: S-layer protein, partial [Cyanobacteria bacterium RYN_339]|nr:S-layer protein [Cyanobacteria bacterium RYN_339]